MTKKSIVRIVLFITVSVLCFWLIRFATFYVLVVLPVLLLMIDTIRKRLWATDKERLKANIIVVFACVFIYRLLEGLEMLHIGS